MDKHTSQKIGHIVLTFLISYTFYYIIHGPHFTLIYNDYTLDRQLLKYWYSVTQHPEDGSFEPKHVGVSVENKRVCILFEFCSIINENARWKTRKPRSKPV